MKWKLKLRLRIYEREVYIRRSTCQLHNFHAALSGNYSTGRKVKHGVTRHREYFSTFPTYNEGKVEKAWFRAEAKGREEEEEEGQSCPSRADFLKNTKIIGTTRHNGKPDVLPENLLQTVIFI